jgi:hypothetical protein
LSLDSLEMSVGADYTYVNPLTWRASCNKR